MHAFARPHPCERIGFDYLIRDAFVNGCELESRKSRERGQDDQLNVYRR